MKPSVRIFYVAVFVIGTKALYLLTDGEIAMLFLLNREKIFMG